MVGTIVLAIAVVVAGLTAGVFFAYATAVMPGLRRVGDRTFVRAFQAIEGAVMNPLFIGGGFFGTLVLAVAAALLHLGEEHRATMAWSVAAAVLQLVVIVLTGTIHVPRNDAIRAAGDPEQLDVAAVRAAFDERRWARWNLVRVVLSTAVVGCLAVALAVG